MRDLTGRTALTTGSARGIGKAIALRYARLGANIVVNYASSAKDADATVAEIERLGAEAIAVQADDHLFAINTRGAFFTLQAAARHVVNGGRIIYVGSSTTTMPVRGEGLYGSSKTAPRYAVQVLAQELADRGVTVNTILPTAIEGAGVFTEPDPDHPVRQFVARPGRIGRRMGTVDDVADAAEYLASGLAAWISGQSLLISGVHSSDHAENPAWTAAH
ncbi:SDR family oxidoreductase [Streptomyces sp. NPDC004270]